MSDIWIIDPKPNPDMVEVVRCRDCKCLYVEDRNLHQHCTLSGIPVDLDDFCSYGERREE